MKFLKIIIMSLSMGIFVTACNNNVHCPPSAADSSAAAAGSSANSSDSAATPVAATSPDNTTTGTATESGTGNSTTHHNVNGRYANTKDSTMVKEKKREGNFTSGTGADNPGK